MNLVRASQNNRKSPKIKKKEANTEKRISTSSVVTMFQITGF